MKTAFSLPTKMLKSLVFCDVWIIISLAGFVVGGKEGETEEYCQMETFSASCPPGHVIMMEEARYGRMRLGRCLERDYFLNCAGDVLPIMDSRCSGRRKCDVGIPDPVLVNAQPCPKDIVVYLEARYTCLPVLNPASEECEKGDMVLSQPSGYLAAAEHSGGATPVDCIYHIQVEDGQRISLALYDFLAGVDSYQPSQHRCTVYGTVYEEDKETVVCSAFQRHTIIYTSSSNHIAVQLLDVNFRATNNSFFVLKFQAEGCANLPPPEDGYIVRRGDQLNVVCNKTTRSWHLVCRDTTWVGEIDNCSSEHSAEWNIPSNTGDESVLHFPHGMVIAVIIGVALGVLIGFLLLFFIYAARRRSQKQKQQRWAREGKALLYETSSQPQYAGKRPGDSNRAPPAPYRPDLAQRFLQQTDCEETVAIPMGHVTRSQGAHGVHVYESTGTPGLDDRTILRGSFMCDCDSRCDSGLGLSTTASSGTHQ